jgi:hypothetical protein
MVLPGSLGAIIVNSISGLVLFFDAYNSILVDQRKNWEDHFQIGF